MVARLGRVGSQCVHDGGDGFCHLSTVSGFGGGASFSTEGRQAMGPRRQQWSSLDTTCALYRRWVGSAVWLDGRFPGAIQIAALHVSFLGYCIIPWAVAHNKFFSQIVRIRSDRGHSVAASGPYRFVRHPSYLGMIAFELAVPIMLASWWSLLISAGSVFLLILRTALEDRTLRTELAGLCRVRATRALSVGAGDLVARKR